MNKILSLKKRIMTRIYFEYAKSLMIGYPDYFMLGVFTLTTLILVSVGDVFGNIFNLLSSRNMAPSSLLSFFWAAVMGTSWIIQLLILGFIVRILVAGSKVTYKGIRNTNFDFIPKLSKISKIRLKY